MINVSQMAKRNAWRCQRGCRHYKRLLSVCARIMSFTEADIIWQLLSDRPSVTVSGNGVNLKLGAHSVAK